MFWDFFFLWGQSSLQSLTLPQALSLLLAWILPVLGAGGGWERRWKQTLGGWSGAAASTKMCELYRCLVSLILCGAADVSSNHQTVSNCYPKLQSRLLSLWFLMTAFEKDFMKLKRGQRDEFFRWFESKDAFFSFSDYQVKKSMRVYKCLVLLHQKTCIQRFYISRIAH